MSGMVRTVKLKLDLPYQAAEKTVHAWTDACNRISQIAFDNGKISNAVKLQKLAYEAARATGLSAQIAISCIRHVASKYAAVRSNPHNLKAACAFKQQAVILQGGKRGHDVALRACGLSVWTLEGRFKSVPFHGPPGLEGKLTNWAFGDGRLFICPKSKTVFLTLSFKKEVEQRTAPNDAMIGVDRGIHVIACATDGRRNYHVRP